MIVSGMSSTELIAQADRRYAEVVEGRKVWLSKAAWTTGYIEGWMDGQQKQKKEGTK